MAVMAASRSDRDADADAADVAGYSNAMRSELDRALGAVDVAAGDAAVVGCCYCWRTFVNDCSMVAVASEDSVGLLLLLAKNENETMMVD